MSSPEAHSGFSPRNDFHRSTHERALHNKVIIGMGLPGAGKSIVLSGFAARYGYEYISFDEMRTEMGLNRAQSSTEEVFEKIASRAIENYRAKKTVVVDGTFLNDMRVVFINLVRAHGIQRVQGLFVNTPPELAWQRVSARHAEERTTRELFEARLVHLKKKPPGVTEGFDSLFTLDENGRLFKIESSKRGPVRQIKRRLEEFPHRPLTENGKGV